MWQIIVQTPMLCPFLLLHLLKLKKNQNYPNLKVIANVKLKSKVLVGWMNLGWDKYKSRFVDCFQQKPTSVGTKTYQTNTIKLEKYRIQEEASKNNTQIV